ncbi:MAG: type VI secretion system ATPase TssH, partial [Bacteroidales bacterium]|nr:type VI secretion system ATPase TssH [Bacteroidales bacterium]MDD4713616.1 type VI secretion system ATPase TssH [Bacteroidales bacterium]
IRQIVNLQLNGITKQLEESGIKLEVTDKALDWIAKIGYDPQYGARPIKRVLQRNLLNELSKRLIAQDVDRSVPIVVDEVKDALVFRN